MVDIPDIPDFLNRKKQAFPVNTLTTPSRKARATRKKQPFNLPRNLPPESVALLKATEKEKQRKKAERLKALKSRR